MKMYLMTILICVAICLIVFGVRTNNLILLGIGGFLVGAYHATIQTKLKEK